MDEPDRPELDPLGLIAAASLCWAVWALLTSPDGLLASRLGAFVLAGLALLLLLISIAEWRLGLIPDVVTLPGTIAALAARGILGLGLFNGVVGCALLCWLAVAISRFSTRKYGVGLGGGVPKLLALVGAALGTQVGLIVFGLAWLICFINVAFMAIAGHRPNAMEVGPGVAGGLSLAILLAKLSLIGPLL